MNDIGYSQTKFVAESIVRGIAAQLPSGQNRFSVVRPGLVIGTAEEGVSIVDDFVWRLVATASRLKLCPSICDDWMAIGDAKFVASEILSHLSRGEIFAINDLSSKSGLSAQKFWGLVNSELQPPCADLPWKDWVERALEDMNRVGSPTLYGPSSTSSSRIIHQS
jgi:thioester reductase-like protein